MHRLLPNVYQTIGAPGTSRHQADRELRNQFQYLHFQHAVHYLNGPRTFPLDRQFLRT